MIILSFGSHMTPYLLKAVITLIMISGDLNKNLLIMMLSENYESYFFGVKHVTFFLKVGSSHRFWAMLSFALLDNGVRREFWSSRVFFSMIMGGKRKWVEPSSYVEWKNKLVWDILRRVNFTGYMERLKGNNPTITH